MMPINEEVAHAPDVIVASNVSKVFGARAGVSVNAVEDVSFTARAGERLAVVGPSGSGKSTLLHCLCGFEAVSSGDVTLLGNKLASLSARQLAKLYRREVGFVFQQYNLVAALSAFENAVLPIRLDRRSVDRGAVKEVFELLGLERRENATPATMSGGEQQRVAVARAMLVRPRVLFADEPTGALDTATGHIVMTALEGLADAGATLIYVTHDPALAARAERVLVMRDGRLLHELRRPSPEQVLAAMGSRS